MQTEIKIIKRIITPSELKSVLANQINLTLPVPGKIPWVLSATSIYQRGQVDYSLTPDTGAPYLFAGDFEIDWLWSDDFLTAPCPNLMQCKTLRFGANSLTVPVNGLALSLRVPSWRPAVEPYTLGDGSVKLIVKYYEVEID